MAKDHRHVIAIVPGEPEAVQSVKSLQAAGFGSGYWPEVVLNGDHRSKERTINFFLRAKTSVCTLRLPCVREVIEEGDLKVGFNWVVFEEDVTFYSYQLYGSLLLKDGTIEPYELSDAYVVTEADSIYHMAAREVCHIECCVPLAFVLDLDRAFTPDK